MAAIKTIDGGKHAAPAARDLTTKQWYAAILVPLTGEIDVAGANADVIGVIELPGDAKGKTATVLTVGQGKVRVTYDAKAGDRLMTAADGSAVKATAGKRTFGIVLEPTPNGAYAPFIITRGTEPAS